MKKINYAITTITIAIIATVSFGFSGVNMENSISNSNTENGKEIFSAKGCTACHQVETKTVGPSIKTIAEAYKGNKKGLISFFKKIP